MPAEPVPVDQPKHPLHALTTSEWRGYRARLESALASSGTENPGPPARGQLQDALDAVIAEEQDRKRLADAR
jgi:hypothetical protein